MLAADLAAPSNRSVAFAVGLAQLYAARLLAVHLPALGAASGESPALSADCRRQVEKRLSALCGELVSREGKPADVVSRLLEERSADALVLDAGGAAGAIRPRGPNRAADSPAKGIFRRVQCAVFTLGPRVAAAGGEASPNLLERILYITDFSVESLSAAPYAVSLASRARAQLVLAYAGKDGQAPQTEAARQTLRDLVPLGTRLAMRPRCLVEPGALAEVALRLAAAENAHLLVLGIPREEEIASRLQPSITGAWRISLQAPCPVLTVRG